VEALAAERGRDLGQRRPGGGGDRWDLTQAEVEQVVV